MRSGHEGVVIVLGIVATDYLKQMVQTIVLRVNGIRGLVNLVEVRVENYQADA